jgi:hypothetical protein
MQIDPILRAEFVRELPGIFQFEIRAKVRTLQLNAVWVEFGAINLMLDSSNYGRLNPLLDRSSEAPIASTQRA